MPWKDTRLEACPCLGLVGGFARSPPSAGCFLPGVRWEFNLQGNHKGWSMRSHVRPVQTSDKIPAASNAPCIEEIYLGQVSVPGPSNLHRWNASKDCLRHFKNFEGKSKIFANPNFHRQMPTHALMVRALLLRPPPHVQEQPWAGGSLGSLSREHQRRQALTRGRHTPVVPGRPHAVADRAGPWPIVCTDCGSLLMPINLESADDS